MDKNEAALIVHGKDGLIASVQRRLPKILGTILDGGDEHAERAAVILFNAVNSASAELGEPLEPITKPQPESCFIERRR